MSKSKTEGNYSPKDWDQIEDINEVKVITANLEKLNKVHVYDHAELYDIAYPGYEGDMSFYLKKGRVGKVLYLGIGSGRIFSELVKVNQNIIGIDNSVEMLNLLYKKFPHINKNQAILKDALVDEFPTEEFDLVLAPYSFMQCFEVEQLEILLSNVKKWLKPNGKFYTDTFSTFLIPFRKKGLETIREKIGDIDFQIFIKYNHILQKMREWVLIKKGEKEYLIEMNLNYYFPHEIFPIAKKAHLKNIKVFGDYSEDIFDPTLHNVISYEMQK